MKHLGSQRTMDIKYMKLLRLCLLPVGGWPNLKQDNQTSWFNISSIYMIIQLIVVIGEVIYLHYIFGDVDVFLVGDVYITMFLTILSLIRLSLPHFKMYGDVLRKLITEMHLINFKHKGESFKKVSAAVDEILFYIIVIMIGMGISGLMLFNFSPMYANIKNGAFTSNRHNLTLEFSVKYKYPGYDQREKLFFTTVINFYLSFLCSSSIISIDLLLITIIFHIVGHFEILAMNLRSVPKPKTAHFVKEITNKSINVFETEIFDEEENLEIKQRLQELVDHHNLIISFTEDISKFFGPMLGFNYLYHLFSCCLLLLECSRGDPDVIVRYGPLTATVFLQLIQISVIFEILAHKSSVLIDCVYDLPWQCMNIDNQRIVCIMLQSVQSPVLVTAFGLVGVGVKTMANILKTTFSYFTFLRSL